jgi:hypothetical protein
MGGLETEFLQIKPEIMMEYNYLGDRNKSGRK